MLVDIIDKDSKDIVFIYTTCPGAEVARSIATSAIEEKLAVCGDFWTIESVYPWQGVMEDVEQYMLVLTTDKGLAEKLMKFISGMHPYSVPMIACATTSMVNSTYKFWTDNTLNNRGDYITESEEKSKRESDENNGYHYGKLK